MTHDSTRHVYIDAIRADREDLGATEAAFEQHPSRLVHHTAEGRWYA